MRDLDRYDTDKQCHVRVRDNIKNSAFQSVWLSTRVLQWHSVCDLIRNKVEPIPEQFCEFIENDIYERFR